MKQNNNVVSCGCGKTWPTTDKDHGYVTCDDCKKASREKTEGMRWTVYSGQGFVL